MSQTAVVTHQKAIRKDNPALKVIGRVLLYTVLIAMALFTLIPFVWMLSSSLKLDQEVFQSPSAGFRKRSIGKTTELSGNACRC